jgi:hypothetical protein
MKPDPAPDHGAPDSFGWYRSLVERIHESVKNPSRKSISLKDSLVNSRSRYWNHPYGWHLGSVTSQLSADSAPSAVIERPPAAQAGIWVPHPFRFLKGCGFRFNPVPAIASQIAGFKFTKSRPSSRPSRLQPYPTPAPYICPSAPAHKLIVFSSSLPIALR